MNNISWHIEATSKCILECPLCDRTWFYKKFKKRKLHEINVDHLLNFFDGQSYHVHFCGNNGDPIYHSEFHELCQRLKKINCSIDITTNGSKKSIEWWEKLGSILTTEDEIKFSIDGLQDTNKLYRINSDWDSIMQGFKIIKKYQIKTVWKFIVFKHNQHQVTEAKTLSQQLGFQSIRFQYSDRFLKDKKTIVYENNKQTHILEQASDQDTIHELTKSNQNEFYTKKLFKIKHDPIECPWAKQKKLFINNVGWVLPCCHMANILAGKQIYKKLFEKIIGSYDKINLHYYSLEQILLSKIYLKQIPNSIVSNRPHPNCIEHCSTTLSKNKIRSNESTLLNS